MIRGKRSQEESTTMLIFGILIVAVMAFAAIFLITGADRARYDSATAEWKNEAYIMARRLLSSKDCLAHEKREIELVNTTDDADLIALNAVSPFSVDYRKLTDERIRSCMLYDSIDAVCMDCPADIYSLFGGACPPIYCEGDFWGYYATMGGSAFFVDEIIKPRKGEISGVDMTLLPVQCLRNNMPCCVLDIGFVIEQMNLAQLGLRTKPPCCSYHDYCPTNPFLEFLCLLVAFPYSFFGVCPIDTCYPKPTMMIGFSSYVIDETPCDFDDDGDAERDEFEYMKHQMYIKMKVLDTVTEKTIYDNELNLDALDRSTLQSFVFPIKIMYSDFEAHEGEIVIEISIDTTFFNARVL